MQVESPPRRCAKCKAQEATLDSRSQPVCKDCFMKFIMNKCVKQIALLAKETRPSPSASGGPSTGTRRYLLGLSFGLSSTVLLHLLNENVEFQLARGRNLPFELIVVHIDTTSLSPAATATAAPPAAIETLLAHYRARYPRFTFHSVPLSSFLPSFSPPTPSSSSSSSSSSPSNPAPHQLTALLTSPRTPAASRADLLNLLTHRALRELAGPAHHACHALLLGHSTTALAELTLAAAAQGRGWALPWLVQDGAVAIGAPAPEEGPEAEAEAGRVGLAPGDGDGVGKEEEGAGQEGQGRKGEAAEAPPLLVYRPLREVLRKELVTYASLTEPMLDDLLRVGEGDGDGETKKKVNGKASAVVSHRDLSIEEVMTRYFAEVEDTYPSIVANVARTTGKLVRTEGGCRGRQGEWPSRWCGLCRMPLDEKGDERWRGELGLETPARTGAKLCYGCERSTTG